jgi:hypothetical protein
LRAVGALFLTLAPLFPSFFLEKVVSYTAYDWWIRGLLDKYILNYLSVAWASRTF